MSGGFLACGIVLFNSFTWVSLNTMSLMSETSELTCYRMEIVPIVGVSGAQLLAHLVGACKIPGKNFDSACAHSLSVQQNRVKFQTRDIKKIRTTTKYD